jgi:DNA polymerase-3 subunit alpha
MFGAMEFIAACGEDARHAPRKHPVRPIIGCEMYVAPGSRHEKSGTESENKYFHLVLLAQSREGYFNLLKLCSFAYTEGFYYRPRVDEELLARFHGGLICLSACVSGEIPFLIQAGKREEARRKALRYQEIFGRDNFFLEIQSHGIPRGQLKGPLSQGEIMRGIIEISRSTDIPLVATNDVHYLAREDASAHDILLCIGTGKVRTEQKRKKYYGEEFYFKTGEEMGALFPDCPEAVTNTMRIASRCNADVPRIRTQDLAGYLPHFEIPPGFKNADEYLRHLTFEGLPARYACLAEGSSSGEGAAIVQRAEYELGIIITMGFTGYFLIVADFINWAKERGISVGPGRGSGAGSIVAYSLRITDIDPLKYKLIFERFLNPERISMPDFDVDFCNERRAEVIQYVTEKYGAERVAQIITFSTLSAKAVIKDVARTLNVSIPEAEMLSELVPAEPKMTLKKAFEREPKLHEVEGDERYSELFTFARKLEGLHRHSGLHAAGLVIGKSVLHDFVPLYRDAKTGGVATQYTMGFLENCGLVKMDCLGLKTLDLIKHTEDIVRSRGGEFSHFSVAQMDEHNEAAFALLGEGKSEGIFQFESEGMRNVLRDAKPSCVEDLIALNALYRPGPMDNIPQFIESKHGRRKIRFPHPSLEDILKETYGVIVYQEQVLQVAQRVAGYSLGQADILRRAMGKKKMEVMREEKAKFIGGARKNGYSHEDADRIFELLVPFAGYGFNKSHAAAYAILAYHTAYLKANFPAEFMAANLSNEIGSPANKLPAYIDETRKLGIAVDPPNVNLSDRLFTTAGGRIIYGLKAIKGIGDRPAEEIVAGRRDGPYRDFLDFLQRVDIKGIGKKVIELLIATGAFDSIEPDRNRLWGNWEKAVDYAQNIKEDKKNGLSLFGGSGEKEYPDFEYRDFPALDRAAWLEREKSLLGFYVSGHPMDEYRQLWQKVVKADLGSLAALAPGNYILVGIVKTVKSIVTGKGEQMAFAALEDFNGEAELTFFPRVWEKYRESVREERVALIRTKFEFQKNRNRRSFIVEEYSSPEEAGELIKNEEARELKWEKHRLTWKYMADLKLGEAVKAAKGAYTIVGLLTSLRETVDRKGNSMAFGALQDYEGEIELLFFSNVWKENKALLSAGEFCALKGSIDPASDKNPDKPSFKVSSVQDIGRLARAAAKKEALGQEEAPPPPVRSREEEKPEVHIKVADTLCEERDFYLFRELLGENPGDCLVFLHMGGGAGERIIRISSNMRLSGREDALANIKGCPWVLSVWKQ